MIRVLLDEGVPRNLAKLLQGPNVSVESFPNAWKQLTDGDLLDRASRADFQILITCDKRMPYQQNLKDRDISVLVLPTNRLPDLHHLAARLSELLAKLPRRSFTTLDAEGSPLELPTPRRQGSRR